MQSSYGNELVEGSMENGVACSYDWKLESEDNICAPKKPHGEKSEDV